MTGNNRVDYRALKRLIDFHVEQGSDGLVIAGTTGESATLTRSEHIELIRARLRSPTAGCRSLPGPGRIRRRRRSICRALLRLRYRRLSGRRAVLQQADAGRHVPALQAIADAVDKPVMMYNVPGRTVADMLPETVARLAKHDNIFGIKEATGDIERLQAIQALVSDEFRFYSGDDFTLLPFIEQGGHGVVTVSGNVAPTQVATLCSLALAGES